MIVANRNNARFLPQCLESALRQTRSFGEILVVDDASDDDSVRIARSFAASDTRVRVLELRTQRGVAAARDAAIREARCRYLSTLDSDDFLWSPEKNERELACIEAAQMDRPVIAFSDVRRVSVANEDRGLVSRVRPIPSRISFDTLLYLRGFIPRDFTYPTAEYFAVGGYDCGFRLYEDWDLKLRLARRCEYRFTGICGVAYRANPEGLSSAPPSQNFAAMWAVMLKNTANLSPQRRTLVRGRAALHVLWFQRGGLKRLLRGGSRARP